MGGNFVLLRGSFLETRFIGPPPPFSLRNNNNKKLKEKKNLDRAKKLPESRHKPEAMVEVKNGRIGG